MSTNLQILEQWRSERGLLCLLVTQLVSDVSGRLEELSLQRFHLM